MAPRVLLCLTAAILSRSMAGTHSDLRHSGSLLSTKEDARIERDIVDGRVV